MSPNKDFSKLYIVKSGYDENWNVVGGVTVFDVSTKKFDEEMFIDGLTGINGVEVDPNTNNVYVLMSNGTDADGSIKEIKADKTLVKDYTAGIAPFKLLTVE
jgi:DNA-binding beta-propeller fold protein YncE